jgi:ubiquinone/menaquinone biosynthesis C-methylase UbiE
LKGRSNDQIRVGWNRYYSGLLNFDENFKKEFQRCTYNHHWSNSIRLIQNLLDVKDGDKILDAGSGWGRLIIGLLDNYANLRINALDYQLEAIQIGQKLIGVFKNNNVIQWSAGDLCHLSYKNTVFDKVYSARVFQHLNDPKKGVREIVRVLKPEGRFVILLPNKLCPLNINYYAKLYSVGEVKLWFEDIKLNALSVKTMDFSPNWLHSMMIERVAERTPLINLLGGKVIAWGIK